MADRLDYQLHQRSSQPANARPSLPAQAGSAQLRELPSAPLEIKPQPLSAYDDNPVLNDVGAAFIIGVTADCLKKWRQRSKGPNYIQYGLNGPVRYELKALLDYRDKYRVRIED
jgi:hypothetical protein